MKKSTNEMTWWKFDGRRMIDALTADVNDMTQKDGPRLDAWARDIELYGTQLATNSVRRSKYNIVDEEVLVPNKLRRVIDTLHAKVIRNKVLPQCISTAGDYTQRSRAKGQSLFLEGLFATENWDRKGDLCARDMFQMGCAFVKVIDVGEKGSARVMFERIKPWTIKVREEESNGELPQRVVIVEDYDVGVLIEEFPEHEQAIIAASPPSFSGQPRIYERRNQNARRVMEAWSAPIGAKPGRHVIALQNQVLLDEEWHDPIPVADLRGYVPTVGYWPISMTRLLAPIQRELEFTASKLQATFQLMSHAHFILAPGADVTTEQITDEPGTIWRANPGSIQAFAPNTVAPDLYRYFSDLGPMMTEMSGASAMSVANTKPGGITSGVALNTLDNVEAEGLMALHRAWQDWHVRIGELALYAARRVAQYDSTFSVRVLGKGRGRVVKFKDVTMAPEDFVLRVTPISQFSKDFAARIDEAEKLLQLGALSVPQFREILDLPDLQAESDLDLSDLQIIDRNLEAILTKQIPVIAEPFDNLEMIVQRGAKAYNLARLEDADPVALELLRRYIVSAQELLAASQPPPPPAPGPGALPPELASMGQPAPALA